MGTRAEIHIGSRYRRESPQRPHGLIVSTSTSDITTRLHPRHYPELIKNELQAAAQDRLSKVPKAWGPYTNLENALDKKSKEVNPDKDPFHESVGGNGNNIARWLAALHGSEKGAVTLLTWAGKDEAGNRLKNNFKDLM